MVILLMNNQLLEKIFESSMENKESIVCVKCDKYIKSKEDAVMFDDGENISIVHKKLEGK